MDYGLVVVRTTDRYRVVCRTEQREQLTWGFVVWGERRYIPVCDCLGCVLAAIWVGDGREREREREKDGDKGEENKILPRRSLQDDKTQTPSTYRDWSLTFCR